MYHYEIAAAAAKTVAGPKALTDPNAKSNEVPNWESIGARDRFAAVLERLRARYPHAHLTNCPRCAMLLLRLEQHDDENPQPCAQRSVGGAL